MAAGELAANRATPDISRVGFDRLAPDVRGGLRQTSLEQKVAKRTKMRSET